MISPCRHYLRQRFLSPLDSRLFSLFFASQRHFSPPWLFAFLLIFRFHFYAADTPPTLIATPLIFHFRRRQAAASHEPFTRPLRQTPAATPACAIAAIVTPAEPSFRQPPFSQRFADDAISPAIAIKRFTLSLRHAAATRWLMLPLPMLRQIR
jgi:hypothetical protein